MTDGENLSDRAAHARGRTTASCQRRQCGRYFAQVCGTGKEQKGANFFPVLVNKSVLTAAGRIAILLPQDRAGQGRPVLPQHPAAKFSMSRTNAPPRVPAGGPPALTHKEVLLCPVAPPQPPAPAS